MNKINWENNVTKLNADTMNEFQENIEEAIDTTDNKITNVLDTETNKVKTDKIKTTWIKNIDDLTTAGMYFFGTTIADWGGTPPSGIGGNGWMILVGNDNPMYNVQLAFGFGSDKIGIRRRNNSSTWTSWKYVTLS